MNSMTTTKPTRALARGLEVIHVLNERPSTPIGLLGERTGMSRATLLRILSTLDAAGWIYRYRADGNYRLSSQICRLGQHVLTADRLVESAAPVMDRLLEEFGLPLELAARKGIVMQILESTRRTNAETSNHNPLQEHVYMLWSASGRAYLAFCPATEREAILDSLRNSSKPQDQAVHNHRWVEELLQDTRERGYGVAESGFLKKRLNGKRRRCAIAAPVIANGQIRACLGLVWSEGDSDLGRMTDERLPVLIAAGQEIAERLRRQEAADSS